MRRPSAVDGWLLDAAARQTRSCCRSSGSASAIGVALVVLAVAAYVLRIQEFNAGRGAGAAAVPAPAPMTACVRSACTPTVLLLASTHFLVDGYGNILAPLLPLLIPQLQPVAGRRPGTLQMCFQLANSVAQLGFGHLADRWRPRVLLSPARSLAVSVLPLIGLAPRPCGRSRPC